MASILNASTSSGLVQTADTSGVLQFQTNSGQTAVTIDTSQNVGIGTTSPVTTTARLSIKANGDYDAGLAIGSNSSVNNWARLDFKNTNAASPAIIYQDQVGTLGIRTEGAYPIIFLTNGSNERMRIDSSGNVGIGTTSPSQRLSVAATTGVISLTSTTGTNYSLLSVANTGTSFYCGIESSTGASLFTGTSPYSGIIGTTGAYPMAFATNNAERMRIDSSGNLLVGKTTLQTTSKIETLATAGTTNGIGVYCTTTSSTGAAVFWNSNGQVGNINVSGTVTSYITSSDYRLKENIAPMTGALDKVSQLKPVIYTWKSDGSNGQGFIAHELQAVVPDCVNGEKDAVNEDGSIKPQGVDTSFLVATLTAAIQEQTIIINDLKARVTALEGATL